MTDAISSLSKKQTRTINFALSRLSSAKSFIPINSIEDFRKVPFGHELKLTGNRMVLLSDQGMEQFHLIVRTLQEADPFSGLADESDLWSACWTTLEELLSNNILSDSANEWLELISTRIEPQIISRGFIAPIVGIDFKDIDELQLGSMKLLRPSKNYLSEIGITHEWAGISEIIGKYRDREL